MAEFRNLDLGQIYQTVEGIKSLRRQEGDDALRQQYMKQQISSGQQAQDIQKQTFEAEKSMRDAKTRYLEADAILNSPDPIGTAKLHSPELIQQFEQNNGAGSFEKLTADEVKNLVSQAKPLLAAHAGIQQKVEYKDAGGQLLPFDANSGQPLQGAKPIEKTAGPSASVGEYNLAKQQGFTGSFFDYQRQLKAAGGTKINVGGPAVESSADKAYGEALGKSYGDVIDQGRSAQEKIDSLRVLRDNPAVTGPTQDFKAAGATLLSELGVPIPQNTLNQVSNLQQYKAVVNKLVLQEQIAQKGPQTESDAKRMQETLAQTTNIREANDLIIGYQMALEARKIERAEFADAYRQKSGKIDGWENEWRAYMRQTPLSGKNPNSGRVVFFDEFAEKMTEANPGVDESEILKRWRQDYGR